MSAFGVKADVALESAGRHLMAGFNWQVLSLLTQLSIAAEALSFDSFIVAIATRSRQRESISHTDGGG
jgi:hypothetical protein